MPITGRKRFPAKVLLFGEYTVLDGGSALAMPLHTFRAQWMHNNRLKTLDDAFFRYLNKINHQLNHSLDLIALQQMEQQGWRFDSDIPSGKGLGSSAALTATLYHHFAAKPIEAPLKTLHEDLARIEAFFHGKSSGMDTLVCYLNQSVRVAPNGTLQPLTLPPLRERYFLLDSGRERSTRALVEWYSLQKGSEVFDHALIQIRSLSNRAIDDVTSGLEIVPTAKELAQLQYQHWHPMIPDDLRPLWHYVNAQDGIVMKICGAGGGGYFLLIATRDVPLPEIEYDLIQVR